MHSYAINSANFRKWQSVYLLTLLKMSNFSVFRLRNRFIATNNQSLIFTKRQLRKYKTPLGN